eukprot:CAMPEP_0168486808 /NCGR_PEP_ID=MMETSP0228-20121227/67312_1 /TAXON_ID=133427 /ORGANISM="Protoceratium reticulatum, Strain CCCM 535 (=CCMP 1889)" /LENGTH=50 /DNA_ID=CAMNT_0008503407 /DNA_START=105 /DNA_END=254 /DNA_ORIENTATION=-
MNTVPSSSSNSSAVDVALLVMRARWAGGTSGYIAECWGGTGSAGIPCGEL